MVKADEAPWVIYLLLKDGTPLYVGMSIDMPRRLREHTRRFGFRPDHRILESGVGDAWSAAERKWIENYRGTGIVNRSDGGRGAQSVALETRQKISAANKGRKMPPDWGSRISAKTKGKPHNWSEKGRAAIAITQFKAGDKLHPKAAEKNRRRFIEMNEAKTPEQMSAEAKARNAVMWAARTPEERSANGRKIADARKRNLPPGRESEMARERGIAAAAKPGARERLGRQVSDWWASLSPESKATFVARRAVTIAAARARKRELVQ